MSSLLRIGLLSALLLIGCGGGNTASDAGGEDGGADTGTVDSGQTDSAIRDSAIRDSGFRDSGGDSGRDSSVPFDAGSACYSWLLLDQPISSLSLIDPAPLHPGRSLRLLAQMSVGGCDELAPPLVVVAAGDETIRITGRVWRRVGAICPDEPRIVDRPITLVPLPSSLRAQSTLGSGAVDLSVGSPPARACDTTHSPCELDCDCTGGARCLGGEGVGGVFTACATPCELDRDCAGDGQCLSIPDGLGFTCETSAPECDTASPCRAGFDCVSGRCEASFTLDATSRHECSCDSDCEAGLSCVRESPLGGSLRCEARCRSGAAGTAVWCQGSHVCGPASADVAGLALSDAVCGFVGE